LQLTHKYTKVSKPQTFAFLQLVSEYQGLFCIVFSKTTFANKTCLLLKFSVLHGFCKQHGSQ